MDIVVDASVIIAVIADEPEKTAIIAETAQANIVAPHSVHWEIGNAFSAMYKRNRVTLAQILQAVQIYKTISIRYVDVDLEASLEIASQLNIYAYDAYLIQAARQYKLPLMTLDKNLAQYAREKGVKVVKVN
ncbi:MAG: type II toxin-antitoxin system VapC family toxin [Chloroflexota bacterium]